LRSKRECLGYKSDTNFIFRDGISSRAAIQPKPRAHKPRNQLLELNPCEATDQELESLALEFFLQDFCVKPTALGLSRGYFQRIATAVRDRGPASRVAKTARLVALEGVGRRWNRPSMRQRARQLYQDELLSFQSRMSDETVLRSEETLMIITMFGLYEVIASP
jgi:hypothetical protein